MGTAALVVSIVSAIASIMAWIWAVRAVGQAQVANQTATRQLDLATDTVAWNHWSGGRSLFLGNTSREHVARGAIATVTIINGNAQASAGKRVEVTSGPPRDV